MSELDFEQMLQDSFKTIHNGEVVEGTILDVKSDEAILNINYKADGILSKREYSNDLVEDLRDVLKVGDKLDVKILKLNDSEGQAQLSHKRVLQEKGNETLKQAFENEEVLKAKVTQILNGGLSVVVDGAKVFIPASLVSDQFERDLSKYKDQEIEFVITEFNPKRNRIIGDRKRLIMEEKKEIRKELFSKINVGDTIEGKIKNITEFGAFVDMGGVDGLLHISEMSWGRVNNPKELFEVGQTVKAFIKDIRNEKVALSMKFPEENPWAKMAENYQVGSIVKGKVVRMADFGAFVEIESGVDALLHVSQISYDHIEKPSDVLKVGDEVEAKIVDLNEVDHKISLSIKALQEPAKEENEAKPSDETVEAEEVTE